MSTSFLRRSLALGLTLSAIVVGGVALHVLSSGRGRSLARADVTVRGVATQQVAVPAGATTVTVGRASSSRAIPPGFLGLSLEYSAILPYAGSDPRAVDPVLVQLIRNLTPGRAPVLRIGGDSTDLTWWPAPHVARPAGLKYTLTARWVAVTRSLVKELDARVVLGINLEADDTRLAAAEARVLVAGLGRDRIEALELGNEPELYGAFTWDGSGATGRPRGYGFAGFEEDVSRMARALPRLPLADPATGSVRWFPDVGELLAAQPRVGVVSLHRYPLQLCFVSPTKPNYPTIANLLATAAARGQAASVAADVRISHRRGVLLRIDEMNTISCGSDPAIAKSFASALWVLDDLFEMARVGVDGVNVHTYPGATYELFTFAHVRGMWRAVVEPEYYGMLMFAQAAPPGSRLVRLSLRPRDTTLKAWATSAPDGQVRVVLINDSPRPQVVVVREPAAVGASTLERLTAPSIDANRDVTLGGLSFGAETGTGLLAGRPHAISVAAIAGSYALRVPAATAAMLTIP